MFSSFKLCSHIALIFLKCYKNAHQCCLATPFYLACPNFVMLPGSIPKLPFSNPEQAKSALHTLMFPRKLKMHLPCAAAVFNSEHKDDMLYNSEFQQTPGNQAVCVAQMRPDMKRLVVTSVATSLSDSGQVVRCIYKAWYHTLRIGEKEKQVKNNASARAIWEKNGKLLAI